MFGGLGALTDLGDHGSPQLRGQVAEVPLDGGRGEKAAHGRPTGPPGITPVLDSLTDDLVEVAEM